MKTLTLKMSGATWGRVMEHTTMMRHKIVLGHMLVMHKTVLGHKIVTHESITHE